MAQSTIAKYISDIVCGRPSVNLEESGTLYGFEVFEVPRLLRFREYSGQAAESKGA